MTASNPRPQTVLITGCSAGGIGFALARAFHARGLHVFATARSPSKMSALTADLEGGDGGDDRMTLLALDVTDPASIAAAAQAVCERTDGSLDYLVNNAGALYVTPALDGDLARARGIFDVNFWGVVAVTQAFGGMLVEAGGCVVNVSSVGAVMCAPYYGYYAASKAAMQTLSETMRREMKPLGVRVVTLMSGSVESRVFDNGVSFRLPEDSYYRPAEKEIAARAGGSDVVNNHCKLEEYARTVVGDVLGGKEGKLYRGKHSSMVAILERWLPTWLFDWISVQDSGLDRVGKPKQL